MMEMVLYHNCPVNGRDKALKPSRVAIVAGTMTREDWFASLPAKRYNVNSVRLGEPIRLKASIEDILGYEYGFLRYKENGTRYYFYVVDMLMITEDQTEIHYNIDPYETIISRSGIPDLTAHITNISANLLPDVSQAYIPDPVKWDTYFQFDTHRSEGYLLATGFSDNFNTEFVEGGSHTFTIMYKVSDEGTLSKMLNGQWFSELYAHVRDSIYNPLGITPADIYYMAYIPCDVVPVTDWSQLGWRELYTSLGHDVQSGWWSMDVRSIQIHPNLAFPNMAHIASSPEYRWSIVDARDNLIWECPIGHTYDLGDVYLEWNATSASVMVELSEGSDKVTVSVPCETVDLYSSSWAEYFYRQRETDRSLRQTQMLSNLGKTAIGTASSAGIGGAYSGKSGAASAFAGDVVSSLGGWLVDSVTDPYVQRIHDRQARSEADPLSLAGSMTSYLWHHNRFGVSGKVMDEASKEQFRNMVDTEGYDVDLWSTDVLDRLLDNHETCYLKGYFKMTGPAPRSWLAEIERRLSEGVTFIEYNIEGSLPEGGAGAQPV